MFQALSGTTFLGKTLKYFDVCGSTNDSLRELIMRQSLPEGTLVICREQTRGKGQRGNTWQADPGNSLTFSILFYPYFLSCYNAFYINKAIATGIAEGIEAMNPGLEISVKWPNDIYYKDYKIGGILVESMGKEGNPDKVIAGIGLNVNQASVNVQGALSLREAVGEILDLQDVLEFVGSGIENQYKMLKNSAGDLDAHYMRRLYRKDGWHFFNDGSVFRGKIEGVDKAGKLILMNKKGELRHYGIKELAYM